MKVSLDIDDPSVLHSGLDYWLKLKEHYPDFKVSLFWIPFDPHTEVSQLRLMRDEKIKELKDNLDWIQLIPHGLNHIPREFEKCDYHTMKDLVLPAIRECFDRDGLPFEKGFKAPYWLWNEEVIRALDDAGWWSATDRNDPKMLKTKRNYTYTHSIDEPFWLSTNDTLNLHGHLDGVSSNDMEKCFLNLLKLPTDVEWRFVTDFIEGGE